MAKKRRSSQFKDSSQVIDIEEARRKRQAKRKKQQKIANLAPKTVTNGSGRTSIKRNKRKRTLIYTAIILAIIAVVSVSIYNIISLKQEQRDRKDERSQLRSTKEAREKELEHINDPEYIEEQGRVQLRLVRPGEKIYVFPSLKESDKALKESEEEKDKDED